MLASPPPRVLRFDVFTLDPVRCTVARGGNGLALRRRAFDVLRFLAEHAGETVSKEQLLAAIWPGISVTDNSVVQCIKEIRQALGEDAHWIIRTVSGRGYQFMAEVAAVEQAPRSSSQPCPTISQLTTAPAAKVGLKLRELVTALARMPSKLAGGRQRRLAIAAGLLITVLAGGGWVVWQRTRSEPPAVLTMMAVPTLAVLPFEALGNEPDLGDAAPSLSSDLAIAITRASLSWMLSYRSASGYRSENADLVAAGRQLDARYLVLGKLTRQRGILRANIELIDAQSRRQIWATEFEYSQEWTRRALPNIAMLLNYNAIAAESRRPLPSTPEAAHYNLLGRSVVGVELDPEANKKALAFYEKSLAIDRNQLPTLLNYIWTQLALVDGGLAPADEAPRRLDLAEQAIAWATRLNATDASILMFRAKLLRLRGDLDGAAAELGNLWKTNQNSAFFNAELGRAKIDVGRADETIAHVEKAIRDLPGTGALHLWQFWAGQAALLLGEDKVALQWLQKARRVNYTDPVPGLAVALARLGREDEARALLAEHAAKTPRFTVSDWVARHAPRNAVAAAQFARIADTLRRLDTSGGKVEVGSGR